MSCVNGKCLFDVFAVLPRVMPIRVFQEVSKVDLFYFIGPDGFPWIMVLRSSHADARGHCIRTMPLRCHSLWQPLALPSSGLFSVLNLAGGRFQIPYDSQE